jgi:peroxiredoxin/predicted negative regulator of RcsB-dependent stress response
MGSKQIALASVFCLAMVSLGARAFTQGDAARELKQTVTDLRAKASTTEPDQYVGVAERALLDFSKKYPHTPEGAKAHMYLAGVYLSVGKYDGAARELETYLGDPVKKDPGDLAQARYLAGSAYLALDDYDKAEAILKQVVASGTAGDKQVTQAAANDLGRIAILRKLKIGSPAIELAAVSTQGKKIRLADYRGKVVLLDFWAAWCMPCKLEMPNVINVYGDLHKKGFEIIGISLDTDKARFEEFTKSNGMTWPQIYDGKGWQSELAGRYAVTGIPATFLLDKQGKIRYKNVRGDKLRIAVEELLGKK